MAHPYMAHPYAPSRIVLLTAAMALLGLAGCSRQQAAPPSAEAIESLARQIHANVITIDTHVDIPVDFATDTVDPGERGRFQNDLVKMEEGGLDAAFFIVYVGQGERTAAGNAAATAAGMNKFNAIRRMTTELYPDRIELAYSADDVERIHAEGKRVALIGVENAYALGDDVSSWSRFHELGARYVSLTHNGHNDFGDSSVEMERLGDTGPEWGGMSPLGREAVAELNRLGIMVDVSHAGRETMLQTVAASRAPVIASHSSVRAIADHARNLDDEQLRALAAAGGVAQMTALGAFVKVQPERNEALSAARERFSISSSADIEALDDEQRSAWELAMSDIDSRFPPATVQDFVDHIDHAVSVAGIDHVGISSDFDGGGGIIGWNNSAETFNVTHEMVRRGYTEEQIRKLWGGNLLRVMREVERVAKELQAS